MYDDELEAFADFEGEFDDLLPACKLCDRWLAYKDNKGICSSTQFEKDSYTTILTKSTFFCGDFKPKMKIKSKK